MLPLFIPHIQQGLASGNVSFQYASLIAMALLTEGCHESFKSELNNIVGLITPLMQSQNPRIMHGILMVVGYMSEEFAP